MSKRKFIRHYPTISYMLQFWAVSGTYRFYPGITHYSGCNREITFYLGTKRLLSISPCSLSMKKFYYIANEFLDKEYKF